MRKTLSGLQDLAGILYAANRRYLTFLSALDLEPCRVGQKKLNQISETVRVDGRACRSFNFFSQDDQRLLEVLTHGEFHISGLRNRSLRSQLPDLKSGQISRMLQRLRHHGILRAAPKTYKVAIHLTQVNGRGPGWDRPSFLVVCRAREAPRS